MKSRVAKRMLELKHLSVGQGTEINRDSESRWRAKKSNSQHSLASRVSGRFWKVGQRVISFLALMRCFS